VKYITEFRNKDDVQKLAKAIGTYNGRPVQYMEVCGGHTMSIQRFGIPSMLPESIRLISGPGCPVCVTSTGFIDQAIALSRQTDTIIATYGDLIRVPGSNSSLENERGKGADIRIVLSSLAAIQMAIDNQDKKVIFLGIGFETTAPATAVAIQEAHRQSLENFYVLSAHKIMPPAMDSLLSGDINLDGFIAPGHVSAITGSKIYEPLVEKYQTPVVISGFEPLDILYSVWMLINQTQNNTPGVEIQYKRVVNEGGNTKALELMDEIFEPEDDWWRGLGVLPNSGLGIRTQYRAHDAKQWLPKNMELPKEPVGCICGDILKGLRSPSECRLFGKACHPGNPVGACMVSNEGACQAYYLYGNG
jgi:hydrogenase expression/formation protein HypD